MIQPIDRPLFKVATNLARANGGDPAAIYTKMGGAFRTHSVARKTKGHVEQKPSPLFDVDEATFATSWEAAKGAPEEPEEPEKGKHDPKKGKALLKKVYGGGAPETKKVIKNYKDVIGHLQEHIREGNADKKDYSQSAQLRREIPSLSKASKNFSDLEGYSNPKIVQQRATKRFGKDAVVYRSSKKSKKYMILNPAGDWVHFGALPYEDFTAHGDPERRRNYLNRATKIRGDWAKDPYSPNSLAIHLLW